MLSERSRPIVVLVGNQAADVHDKDLAGPLPFDHLFLERLGALEEAHVDESAPGQGRADDEGRRHPGKDPP